ncbi:response regulator transcription factor [Cohnella yongneupensis]|uniref:Response regulator n=1 Tax=Cohnella yongneupensis TaxID=425006 RepID=A0ABW0QXM6_9BACL
MIRIAIADDESRIRLGLAKMIEHSHIPHKITGTYSDGEEALKDMKVNIADVLITDIKMPVIGGLQLIEELKQFNESLKFIVLSGFRDFDYAKTAIRLGVEDYLLKPINQEELYRLLDKANRERESDREGGDQPKGEAEGRVVTLIKKYIEEEYRKDISLSELAEKVYLNPQYVSQLFKAQTGQTITDYLLQVRIEKAKEIMKYNLELKVYEVGELVGYQDPVYFNRLFKKITGVTPKEYRDKA